MARLPNFLVIIRSEKLSGKGQGRGAKKRTFRFGKKNVSFPKVETFRFADYIYVIRHKGDMRVTRTTTNYHLLKELYDECRMEGEKLIRDMELISQISFAAIFRYLQEFS